MVLRVINDLHLGAIRSAGTTPSTQLQLRQYILDEFAKLLPENDLMILGDLFDKENIPISDVLRTYQILMDWLFKGYRLWLVPGNHDLSKTSSVLSSFDFLASLLHTLFPNQVVICRQAQMTPYGYVIPHVANQDLFDIELAKVPECEYLFLHCNYDNNFAAQLDQSLNLSASTAEKLAERVGRILIAHEHYHREPNQSVLLPGNQVPSSCADWASPQDKFYITVDSSMALTLHPCTIRSTNYAEYDWKSPELASATQRFIRVIGTATPEEAGKAVTQIAKIRQTSAALVISNGVVVQSDEENQIEFAQSLEGVKAFSVWEALKKILTQEEITTLESIMGTRD